MVDAQAIKGADTVGTDTRGWDGANESMGAKGHLVTDTLGLLVVVLLTAGSVQDRDGGRRVLARAMPSMVVVWADGGYAGKPGRLGRHALSHRTGYRSETQRAAWVCCPTALLGVIERMLSWLVRCRRLDHDYERLPAHSEAFIKWAMIGLMTRRLAPTPGRRPWQSTRAS
jgi:transposase